MTYGHMEYKTLDAHVLAVAVEGGVDDWSAYIGATDAKTHDDAAAQDVAARGTKLPRKYAEVLFPGWKGLEWRE